jgi:rfaE bifunctional protein kinase chain/domain
MLGNFSKIKILVIGDIMIDKYIFGKTTKLSFEAPIPLVEVDNFDLSMGGASLVATNISLLGAKAFPVGVIGDDEAGKWIEQSFRKMGIDSRGVIIGKSSNTILRTRVIAENHQIARFDDHEQTMKSVTESKIIQKILDFAPKVDCIVVCDYGKGMLTSNIINTIHTLAEKKIKIIISPVENHLKYKNENFIYRIKLKDALHLLDIEHEEYSVEDVCDRLTTILKSKKIILTKGDSGITIFDNGEITDVTNTHHVARDLTSVGEVLIAAFSVSYASGENFHGSGVVGNVAAGIVVEKIGSKTVNKTELSKALDEYNEYSFQK